MKSIAVRKMQAYIEAHLNEQITLQQLCKVSGYSPYYAAKIFKELTSYSPYYYIKSLRLSKAALQLRDYDDKVLDVALDFVFDSHEGFTRAFSKQFGIRPKAYAKSKKPIPLFLPYPVELKKKRSLIMMQTIFTQVVERPERKLLLKRGQEATEYFKYCEEAGCDVWGILCSVKEAIHEPMGLWLPEALIKPGTSKYVQGVEVPMDYSNDIPDGFEIITLAPCLMMIFQSQPYDDDDFMSVILSVEKAIDDYDPTLYGYEFDDQQPRFQLEPLGERGYIEARPVKKINP